jgi:hypothetical protein
MKALTHLRRNAVAYVALVAALGTGSAFAAGELVGSKQIAKSAIRAKHIKDGQVNSADVKDASLLAGDFAPGELPRGQQGPAGPAGPAGPEGPQGPRGEDGTSVFDDTIPSGETVTGYFGHQAPLATGKKIRFGTSFPVPAPQGPSEVNFHPGSSGGESDPTCTGTHLHPTAPPGKVCLYAEGGSGIGTISGDATGRYGFMVEMTSSGSNNDFVRTSGTWAYTAP